VVRLVKTRFFLIPPYIAPQYKAGLT